MRAIGSLLVVLASAVAAIAEDNSEALQAAAVHIATAKMCVSVTGDEERFEKAVEARRSKLVTAGVAEDEADRAIKETIETAQSEAPKSFTPQFCSDMLDIFERQ